MHASMHSSIHSSVHLSIHSPYFASPLDGCKRDGSVKAIQHHDAPVKELSEAHRAGRSSVGGRAMGKTEEWPQRGATDRTRPHSPARIPTPWARTRCREASTTGVGNRSLPAGTLASRARSRGSIAGASCPHLPPTGTLDCRDVQTMAQGITGIVERADLVRGGGGTSGEERALHVARRNYQASMTLPQTVFLRWTRHKSPHVCCREFQITSRRRPPLRIHPSEVTGF